jgi:hypothetical protein
VKTTEAWAPVMKRLIPAAVIASSALLIGGCSVPIVNDQPSSFRNDVNPVMPEHSLALECLGELNNQSGRRCARRIFVG